MTHGAHRHIGYIFHASDWASAKDLLLPILLHKLRLLLWRLLLVLPLVICKVLIPVFVCEVSLQIARLALSDLVPHRFRSMRVLHKACLLIVLTAWVLIL